MRRLSFLGDEPWNEFDEEGDVVYFPEGRDGLHDFSNPAAEPARIVGISTGGSPMSWCTRSEASHGSRRVIPSGRYATTA
jgi:hypothetical protein